ncbi:MAG TPA: hypothetical protein VI461_02900 [Chitinophagaceae bacterium]|nr:hypothetical protein [Chitinophagaceae bacterium]
MKFILKSILFTIGAFTLGACCEAEAFIFGGPPLCYEVFTLTKTIPLSFTYPVSNNKPFIEAKSITSGNIAKALGEEKSDFKIKEVNLVSASIKYTKDPTNISDSLLVNIGIAYTGSIGEFLLFKENKALPLTPTEFGIPIPVNILLNTIAVRELKKIVKEYGTLVNTGTLFFILRGEGLPKGSLVKFDLSVEFSLSIKYEACRLVPMGDGERECE